MVATQIRPAVIHGLARHRWLIGLAAAAGLGVGLAAAALSPPTFAATMQVLVEPVPTTDLGPAPAADVGTEAELATASDTAADAAALLNLGTSPQALLAAVSARPVAGTSVLALRFEAATPALAQAGARAFARAYLANRASRAHAAIAAQVAELTDRADRVSARLAATDATIARAAPGQLGLAQLRTDRDGLARQIDALTLQLTDLTATPVVPGRVIRDAPLPTAPVQDRPWLPPVTGAAAGLLVGAAAAAAREQWWPYLRDRDDVARRTGVGVLASLNGSDPRIEPPHEAAGRAYHRLRNEVVAALGPADRVVLLTSAGAGSGSTLVAANLAAALARTGHEVVLVGANPPDRGPGGLALSDLFDISDIPGLTDVLSGRTGLGAALQPPPRLPGLRVITPAGPSAGGLLQSTAARSALIALRQQFRYVIVDAPSTAVGADAQWLAPLSDATIVVVETGHDRAADVVDAIEQLRGVGSRLLGVVVVNRLGPAAARLITATGPTAPPWSGPEPARDDPPVPAWLTPERPAAPLPLVRRTSPRPCTSPQRGHPARFGP